MVTRTGVAPWLVAGCLLTAASAASAADWLQWGGPHGDFEVDAEGLAESWPENGPKMLWKRPLGPGYSSILYKDGRLYTMYRSADAEVVVSLDAKTGATLWEHRYEVETWPEMTHAFGSGPNGTPVIVGGRLVTLFAATHARSLYTYDLDQLPPADGDSDGVDNNEDCALDDPGVVFPPQDVTILAVEESGSGTWLQWSDLSETAGTGTVYDVARGVLGDLRIDADPSAATTLVCGAEDPATGDPELPSPGEAFYYLSRGRNRCGVGSWGIDGAGNERPAWADCVTP